MRLRLVFHVEQLDLIKSINEFQAGSTVWEGLSTALPTVKTSRSLEAVSQAAPQGAHLRSWARVQVRGKAAAGFEM